MTFSPLVFKHILIQKQSYELLGTGRTNLHNRPFVLQKTKTISTRTRAWSI